MGEGGPRQWWMRSSRERLTLCRHLIRQPAAATFSHWRRLSFVSALYVNKQCGGNHCIMVVPALKQHNPAPTCHPERRATARSRTRRATAGRDLQTPSALSLHCTSAMVKLRVSYIPFPCFKSFERGTGKTFLQKSFPRIPHQYNLYFNRRLSAIIAINSLLVGLPRLF